MCPCCKWTCSGCGRKFYPMSDLGICPNCGLPVREPINKEDPCPVSVDSVPKSE